MKIYSSPTPIAFRPTPGNVDARQALREREIVADRAAWSPATADSAELSEAGRFVSDLRDMARTEGRFGGIREDVVAATRREIAEGRFGGPEDVERAIDALLMEL